MAYSGVWKRQQSNARITDANPNLGAGADAEHLTPVEPGNPFAEPTPSLPSLPEYMYAADDFMFPAATLVQDPTITEPLDHNAGGVDRTDSNGMMIGLDPGSYMAHMEDHGAAAVHHESDGPVERSNADTYRTTRLEMDRPSAGSSRAALTRGRNALPENNPDGPPDQGHFTMRWIDRQFSRRQTRHDMSPIRPYVAGNAIQIPAPSHANGNQYTSPYARLANARVRNLTTPQIRRVPRPADDSALLDGTADPQYTAPQYWQGW